VGVQEVRWEKGHYNFSKEKEMKIINWEQGILYTIE
jgi:hypothetical protein